VEESYAHPSSKRSPYQTKSRTHHLIIAFAVLILSFAPLWYGFQYFLTEAVKWLLSLSQISVAESSNAGAPLLVVKLLDGSQLSLAMTWQRCGLMSITIFSLLLLFLLQPLGTSLWRKIAWLEFGLLMGLTWSLVRLSLAVLISYHFGAGLMTVADFLTGPSTDIFWAVSTWSLALSTMASKNARRLNA